MMGNTQPNRPSASSLNEVLSILQLIKDPEAVKSAITDLQAENDKLYELVRKNSAQLEDITRREREVAAHIEDVRVASAKHEADSKRRNQEFAESRAVSDKQMRDALALKKEYEDKMAGFRNLLK